MLENLYKTIVEAVSPAQRKKKQSQNKKPVNN